jgi:hypothetical protein|tara:strand:- start:432 stop:695 length:264 start_codon:yes stop_codon:yes gene_type:complete
MSRTSKNYFDFGPFASASIGLDHFAENLYFSYLFHESVEKHKKLEEEYDIALQNNDEEAITKTKYEIDLYNGIFNLTLSYNFDELES